MLNTILTHQRAAIATFSTREAAGQALDHLVFSGFPLAQVFLLDHGLECPDTAAFPVMPLGAVTGTAMGLKKGMVVGNLVGGTSGLFLGIGLMALPGVGQLMVSTAIAFALLSSGIGTAAGGLTGALIGLGLTAKQAHSHSQQVARGHLLLLVEGTAHDIKRAHALVKQSRASEAE